MQTERRTWGRYLLGSLLHTGLETRVVRAQDADAQAVVLKRSRSEPTHPREAGRLHHEFNTLRDLGPLPGLVQVRGLEEVDGTPGSTLGFTCTSSATPPTSCAREARSCPTSISAASPRSWPRRLKPSRPTPCGATAMS